MNYNKIKTTSEIKNIAIKEIAYKIKISEAGLHQMIRNKSMKIETLEKIAEVLEVPITYFFEGENDYKIGIVRDIKELQKDYSGNTITNGSGKQLINVQSNLKDCEKDLDFAKKEIEELRKQISELKKDKDFLQEIIKQKESKY